MDFEFSARVRELQDQVTGFMESHIYPNEALHEEQVAANRWGQPPIMEELKAEAKKQGLWNLFLHNREHGAGLTNLEYAPLAEIMGRSVDMAPEATNCAAPDTGNMEVLAEFANREQQAEWLEPLLKGEIRSAFAMTEPDVASSDAANIATRIERRGDEYVINGRKWWTSGPPHPNGKILILMAKTAPAAPPYRQQSQVLVPLDPPGITVKRALSV